MKSLTVTPFIRDSFENYQKSACGITLDIGRQRINQKELLSLIDFVKEKKMIESFNEMRKGKIVNASEHRSALHTSLRDPSPDAPHAAEVHQTLEAFCKFAEDVRNWKWRGCSGDRITDVINIGIGGSDMGPKCVYNALRPNKPEIKLHFLASADGVIFDRITSVLDPFSTLIVISSKSFKTQETRANTQEILDWLKKAGIPEKDFKHLRQTGCCGTVRIAERKLFSHLGLGRRPLLCLGCHRLAGRNRSRRRYFQTIPCGRPCDGPTCFDRSAAEQSARAHGHVRLLELGKTRRFFLLLPPL